MNFAPFDDNWDDGDRAFGKQLPSRSGTEERNEPEQNQRRQDVSRNPPSIDAVASVRAVLKERGLSVKLILLNHLLVVSVQSHGHSLQSLYNGSTIADALSDRDRNNALVHFHGDRDRFGIADDLYAPEA